MYVLLTLSACTLGMVVTAASMIHWQVFDDHGMTVPFTLCACTRDKAIGRVVVLVVVVVVVISTKIAISQEVGIQGTRKHCYDTNAI